MIPTWWREILNLTQITLDCRNPNLADGDFDHRLHGKFDHMAPIGKIQEFSSGGNKAVLAHVQSAPLSYLLAF